MKENLINRWVVLALALSIACSALASDKRAEPNAFLAKKADTVSQLVHEVETDSDVADRYERHFGKSKEELVGYFGALHLAKLNTEGVYVIYSVDDQGVIKSHPQRLKAGTLVFADATGQPVLKASCGNAMVAGTNALQTTVAPTIGQATDTLHDVAMSPPNPMEDVIARNAVITPTSPVALAPEMPNQISTGTSNQGFIVPAFLMALGGAGSIIIGTKGNNPVPEPATLLVMASALVALKYRRKSK
ncbi:MAG TPA: PEP-CTERM sorting domain-containing protein [Fimbriimonadaceae bacterium]|nr:PEP-CTERM sorting domain-containing protein [Fimbriimonadaceae bacterium]